MEISTVCGLVKEQLFILALAYLLDLSLLLSPLTTFLIVTFPPSKQEVAKSNQAKPIGVILQLSHLFYAFC